MNVVYRGLALLVAVSCLLLVGGCGSDDGPTLKGVVLLEGKPLDNAEVVFEPANKSEAKIGGAIVRTNAEGKFDVTVTSKMGTMKPGKYVVLISKWVDKKTKQAPSEEDLDQLKAAGLAINLVPPQYNHLESPDLIKVDVTEGTNEFEFKLEKKGKFRVGDPMDPMGGM